jgi:citrate lyase subunit beta/citryl-CoA lyase
MSSTALYVPGDRREMLDKAVHRGADALTLDLEDSVSPDRKDVARSTVATWLAELPAGSAEPALWVRINPGSVGHDDVRAVVASGRVEGICLPKARNAEDVRELAGLLDQLGSPARIAPIIEDAGAVLGALDIARASARVARLQLGEADLCAATGIVVGADELELLWARSQVVLASAAAGLVAPLGPVSTNYDDLELLRESTLRLRRLGFGGRSCIHPVQLPVVRAVFTPTQAELADARRTLELLARAGGAAARGADGTMIDEAIARQARALIARAAGSAADQ